MTNKNTEYKPLMEISPDGTVTIHDEIGLNRFCKDHNTNINTLINKAKNARSQYDQPTN